MARSRKSSRRNRRENTTIIKNGVTMTKNPLFQSKQNRAGRLALNSFLSAQPSNETAQKHGNKLNANEKARKKRENEEHLRGNTRVVSEETKKAYQNFISESNNSGNSQGTGSAVVAAAAAGTAVAAGTSAAAGTSDPTKLPEKSNESSTFKNIKTEADALEVFGLTSSASLDDIKKKYRTFVLTGHPNKGGSTKKFQQIGQAYELLQKIHENDTMDSKENEVPPESDDHPEIRKNDPEHPGWQVVSYKGHPKVKFWENPSTTERQWHPPGSPLINPVNLSKPIYGWSKATHQKNTEPKLTWAESILGKTSWNPKLLKNITPEAAAEANAAIAAAEKANANAKAAAIKAKGLQTPTNIAEAQQASNVAAAAAKAAAEKAAANAKTEAEKAAAAAAVSAASAVATTTSTSGLGPVFEKLKSVQTILDSMKKLLSAAPAKSEVNTNMTNNIASATSEQFNNWANKQGPVSPVGPKPQLLVPRPPTKPRPSQITNPSQPTGPKPSTAPTAAAAGGGRRRRTHRRRKNNRRTRNRR